MMPVVNSGQYNSQALYQQFVAFMKGNRKQTLKTQTESQYKKIYSQLRQSNSQRRAQLDSAENKEYNIRTSGCKFTKLEGYQELNSFKTSQVMFQSRIAAETNKEDIQDDIIFQEMETKHLQDEIDKYKDSIDRLSIDISAVKTEIKLVDAKESKFMEAYYLANNILEYSDQHSIVNNRNYNKMLEEQEEVLATLRKMRAKAKNQLAEAQYQLQVQKKDHDAKYKKMVKTYQPLEEQQNAKKPQKVPKSYRRFLQAVQSVLELLRSNEPSFQAIKDQSCTRNISKKINIDLLPADRARLIELTQDFELRHEIKVESTDKLIIRFYRQIKACNEDIEKGIFERKCLIEDYQEELRGLGQNTAQVCHAEQVKLSTRQAVPKQDSRRVNQIKLNSTLFVHTIEQVNSLLSKFRYIFKLFVLMNIDKRKINDHLLKLDEVLNCKTAFTGCGLGLSGGSCSTSPSANEQTNASEMIDLFLRIFDQVDSQQIKQVISLYFNDIRASLIWRKTMVLEELQEQGRENRGIDELIRVLETVRDECEYSYNQKLKKSFKILQQCLISNGKSFVNPKNHRNSGQQQPTPKNKIISNELHLPAGMFAKPISIDETLDEDSTPRVDPEVGKWLAETATKKEGEKIEEWGEEEKKNPSAMIRRLAAIRNQSARRIKVLDLHEPQKKYIKIDMKLQEQKQPAPAFQNKIKSASSNKILKNAEEGLSAKSRFRTNRSQHTKIVPGKFISFANDN